MPATLTVTAEPSNTPPRVKLQVDIPALNTGVSVYLTRLDPDGNYQPVRLADPASIAGTQWIGYDYEAPYGASVTYTAIVQYGDPNVILNVYNLHTNPSFETSTTGWNASSFFGAPTPTSIAQSAAQAFSGTKSLLVTWSASANSFAWTAVNATVGATYNISAYVYVPAGSGSVKLEHIGVTSSASSTTTGAWERLSFTTTATTTNIPFALKNNSANGTAYIDAVMVSPGTSLPNYGDGNTAGWAWDGTTNLSSSQRPANPAGIVTDTVTGAATLAVTDAWLVHPGVPGLSVKLNKITGLAPRVSVVNRGVFQPYGRKTPIVVSDGRRKAPTSQLQVRTSSLAEKTAMNALLDDASVLLLNIPASLGWGVANEYVSLGDVEEARQLDEGADPYRVWTAPYQVVDRPIGGSQSTRTYADVLAVYGTYQTVRSGYSTYGNLLTGP